MEGLDDAVGAEEEHDAAEHEADGARPGDLVDVGVPVAHEQSQKPVDRVAAGEAAGCGRGRRPSERGDGRGQDAVDAVAAERVRGHEQHASRRRRCSGCCVAVILGEGQVG